MRHDFHGWIGCVYISSLVVGITHPPSKVDLYVNFVATIKKVRTVSML